MSALDDLEAELIAEGKLPAPKSAGPVHPRVNGSDVFALANDASTLELLGRLGVQTEERGGKTFAQCPGCREDGALVCSSGGLKCLHARCAHAGPPGKQGLRSNVDIVALVQGVQPLAAATQICEWLGIDVPRRQAPTRVNGHAANGHALAPPPDDDWEPTDADAPDAPPRSGGVIHLPDRSGRPDPQPPTLHAVGTDQIFAPLPPINYLLEPLDICPGAPALIAGFGFSGKTAVAQNIALCVATGLRALESFTVAQGPVLHVDFEQGSRLTFERYQRMAYHLGVGPDDIADRLRVATMPSLYLDSVEGMSALQRAAEGCRMVLIDSLRACAPGVDENSSEVRRVLDGFGRVSEATGASVVVIHHARKPSKDAAGGAKASIRGSGAIFDGCGSVVVFEGEKGKPVRVSHEKARVSGVTRDDFEVVIEDVADERDPRRGLRVFATATAPHEAESFEARGPRGIEAIKPRVLELLKTTPLGSKNAIVESLGANRAATLAAIDVLLADGQIRETGRGSHRRFLA